ncbi:unnamed protein product [Clonostachys solani]|uniref:Non-reducing end beta-L-arabinofuranosidase n=1 Tax=Clonostachys solani TaxID=160281 RepID=A0A9N9ZGL1_9HYPO|nr:unnamed protein product [Clonostachys solani]
MPLQDFPIDKVDITSEFWGYIQDRSRLKTVPAVIEAQRSWNHWTCLTWKEGHDVKPHQFWDSDIYKIVEAACYFLIKHPDEKMRATVEEAVTMIQGAQYDDGYINSFYTVRGINQRWTNLRDDHELYCLGHLLEATVAYETLTKSGRLLEVANKICGHLDLMFGTEPGKKRGYPGHQEVEIGLLRLHDLTKDVLPLKLAQYFITERGRRDADGETFFDKEAFARGADPYKDMGTEHKAWFQHPRDYAYHQADEPLVDSSEVKGHSVRAMYFYTAATDLIRLSPEKEENAPIKAALDRLWRDMIDKKIYVTGGIGSVRQWEGFGQAYSLPDLEHEGCYSETCATFALINWCNRLLRLDLNSEYGDVMEVALYNGFLGAVNQEGDAFYYQNVLRTRSGESKERSKWFGVACCPPNVAKLLGNMGSLIYSHDPSSHLVAIHQYITSELKTADGNISISQKSNLPWQGRVTLSVQGSTKLALRIPSWANGWTCSATGRLEKGYLYCSAENTEIHINLPIMFRKVYSHPATGKNDVCLMRGPLVYCLEDVDNKEIDIDRAGIMDGPVNDKSTISICGLDGVVTGQAEGRQLRNSNKSRLYEESPWEYDSRKRDLIAIPYFLRANRGGEGAMRVWAPRLSNVPEDVKLVRRG